MRIRLVTGLALLGGIVAHALAGAPAYSEPDFDARGREALAADANLEFHPASILVQFDTNAPIVQRQRARAIVNGTTLERYTIVPGLEHLGIDMDVEQAIRMLNALPGVIYAEPDYVIRTNNTPNDEFFDLQWGMHNIGQNIQGVNGIADADIDAVEAWDTSTGDANFVIAIIDTGTQWNHPDLDANIWSNPDEVVNGVDDDGNGLVDDIRGWDFWDNDSNPTDPSGHGTHTAGTVGAEGDNTIGVAGVNWDCELMPLRFLGPNGGFTSGAISCVQYAHNKGVKVSNNSWGGGGFSNSLFNTINATKSIGHIFVAAAGNDGRNTDSNPHYPSSYNLDNIISVAATDNRDRRAGFSNYGPNSVDLGAPGVSIASTYNGSSYVYNQGTSMACPHVAGVTALVYAQNPGWTYQQVRDKIFSSVRAVSSMDGVTVTGGVLNANDALDGGGGGNTPPTVNISSPANNSTFTEGDSVTFVGSANDNEDGNISSDLVWTSNLQGQIGTGASFSTSTLIVGAHVITADVTDSGGASGDDTVNVNIEEDTGGNTPPSTPGRPDLSDLGNGVVRVTWADNSNNEDYFEYKRQEYVNRRWSSSTFETVGANVTSDDNTAGIGRFRYAVRAGNSAGVSSWSNWRIIQTVGNAPPDVSISSPGNNSTFTEGDNITFSGSANDNEDGNISSDLVWTSNLQGQIGTGASFSTTTLIIGQHVITASATDSDGATGDDTVIVNVQEDGGNDTPPATPGRPDLTDLGGGVVRVQWADNSNNEDYFEFKRQEWTGNRWSSSTFVSVGANVTTHDDNPGVGRYRYAVRAGNAAGVSSWSSWRIVRAR